MTGQPIKPVADYLLNGPIPPDELKNIKYLDLYIDRGVVGTLMGIHFMLEHVCVHGAPEWWDGSVPEFEQAFHEEYHHKVFVNKQLDIDATWQAAYEEMRAGRISPLPDEASDEQEDEFLRQGQRRRDQARAVEVLMEMWVQDKERKGYL